jgi:hypothetical protein
MEHEGQSFQPGHQAPDVGIYICDGGCQHEWDATTMAELPSMPEGCRGKAWLMKQEGPIGPMGLTPDQVPESKGREF